MPKRVLYRHYQQLKLSLLNLIPYPKHSYLFYPKNIELLRYLQANKEKLTIPQLLKP